MSWTEGKIEETVEAITKRVSEDSEFRELVKNNPAEAISKISGLPVPETVRFAVVDLDEVDYPIVLPATQNDELSDMDLESVAGGKHHNTNEHCQSINEGCEN